MSRAAAPLAAYVLHRYDWSESSLIVELFTREHGRAVAAAKGAKRPYSQLKPVLLPFQRLHVTLGRQAEGAEVQTLKSAEWAGGGAPLLAGDALFRGFYCNELLLKLLTRHDPHPGLFDAYAQTLPALAAQQEAAAQAALRAFELRLLRDIGLLPELRTATLTQAPVQPAARYALHAESGVVASGRSDATVDGAALVALQRALDEGALASLQAACAAIGAPLRRPLRELLHYHLGTPQLRTRQVLQDAQQLRATTKKP